MNLLVALLLAIAPGDTALEAIQQGFVVEMAQTACDGGDLFACESAAMAGKDPAHLQATMTGIVKEAQKACSANSESFECDLLRGLDRTAAEVMEKHRFHRTNYLTR